MHTIQFRSFNIALAFHDEVLQLLQEHIEERKSLLVSMINLRGLQSLLFFKRRGEIARQISLFFSGDLTLLNGLKKSVAGKATIQSNGSPLQKRPLPRVLQDEELPQIFGHRVYYDLIEYVLENNFPVVFLGFNGKLEVALKYNMSMLHAGERQGGGELRSILSSRVFFIHEQALLQSSYDDIEKLLEKMNPRLIVCERKAIITFHYAEMVKKLNCIFFWLDNATLADATRQKKALPKRKRKFWEKARRVFSHLLGYGLRSPVFILGFFWQAIVWLPLFLHRRWLLWRIKKTAIEL